MKLRKAVKKIVALGIGATMIGATILAASAQGSVASDFAQFPTQFVQNGRHIGYTAVGDAGKTDDTLAALDTNAGLDYAGTAAVGTVGASVSGAAIAISTSSDSLEIAERLGKVRQSLTDSDAGALPFLADYTIRGEGTSKVETTITLDPTQLASSNNANSGSVLWQQNEDDESDYHLFWDDGDEIFIATLDFTDGWDSDIVSSNLDDFEDEEIQLLGTEYTIVDTTVTYPDIQLKLMGGATRVEADEGATIDVTATVQTGTTKKFSVALTYVGDDGKIKLKINGVTTSLLSEGDTETLPDGTRIGVAEVLSQSFAGGIRRAVIYIGAQQITLSDTDTSDILYDASGLEINEDSKTNAEVRIQAVNTTSTKVQVNQISIKWKAEDPKGDTFLAKGEKLSEHLEEKDALLGNLDILFGGMTEPKVFETKFVKDGDTAVEMKTTGGSSVTIPLVSCASSGACFFGEKNGERTVFVEVNLHEGNATSLGTTPMGSLPNDTMRWAPGDKFLLSNNHQNGALSTESESALIEVQSVTAGTSAKVTIKVHGEENQEVQLTTSLSGDLKSGNIPASLTGKTHTIVVNTVTKNHTVDLDGSGSLEDNRRIAWTTESGVVYAFDSNFAPTSATSGNSSTNFSSNGLLHGTNFGTGSLFVAQIVPSRFGDSFGSTDEVSFMTYTITPGGTIPVTATLSSVSNVDGGAVSAYSGTATKVTRDDNSDIQEWATVYGIFGKQTNEDNGPDRLDFSEPDEQAEAQVFITSGTVTSNVAQGGNRLPAVIPVDANVLASELDMANLDRPLITIGGPCANTATRYALYTAQGLDDPADCAEMYADGGAWLRFWDVNGQVVLEVAGLNAVDTRRAGKVLREYAKYNLAGSKVKVEGTSLTDVTVQLVE